jgi:hypothetical protein
MGRETKRKSLTPFPSSLATRIGTLSTLKKIGEKDRGALNYKR